VYLRRCARCAHKKGEVVGPAGGETGVPHCLAEVRKLPEAASFQFSKNKVTEKVTTAGNPVK